MSIDAPWIQAETIPRPELNATYVKLINGVPPGPIPVYNSIFEVWEIVTIQANREGQLVVGYSFDETRYATAKIYVAIDINGTLQWKRCIPPPTYIDVNTGTTPDELKPLYSFP